MIMMKMRMSRSMRMRDFLMHFLVVVSLTATLSLAEVPRSETDQMRLDAKPWLLKNLEISGRQLPVSPITLLILWLSFSFSFLYSTLPKRPGSLSPAASSAVASHILLPEEQPLHEFKQRIGDNPELFAQMAAKYSQCPSAKQGGHLGKFSPGTMAPPFEKAIFDPNAIVVGTTMGPIQTHFGWHLIYVHERTMAE